MRQYAEMIQIIMRQYAEIYDRICGNIQNLATTHAAETWNRVCGMRRKLNKTQKVVFSHYEERKAQNFILLGYYGVQQLEPHYWTCKQ